MPQLQDFEQGIDETPKTSVFCGNTTEHLSFSCPMLQRFTRARAEQGVPSPASTRRLSLSSRRIWRYQKPTETNHLAMVFKQRMSNTSRKRKHKLEQQEMASTWTRMELQSIKANGVPRKTEKSPGSPSIQVFLMDAQPFYKECWHSTLSVKSVHGWVSMPRVEALESMCRHRTKSTA